MSKILEKLRLVMVLNVFSYTYWKGIEKVWKVVFENVWEPC